MVAPTQFTIHLLIQAALAANVPTNSSLPTSQFVYVAGPSTRGTLDILWSSLLTLFLCTYTAQHLNVPSQKDEQNITIWLMAKRKWGAVWRRLKWMLVAIIMPEFLIGRALSDYVAAHKSLVVLQQYVRPGEAWTMSHAFFANMGGFVLKREALVQTTIDQGAANLSNLPQSKPPASQFPVTATAASELSHEITHEKSSFQNAIDDKTSLPPNAHATARPINETATPVPNVLPPIAVNTAHLRMFLHCGLITGLPQISEVEIKDKSKGDIFVKGCAVFQVLWLIIELVVRKARGLPTSQLEVAILAFSACTFVTYLFWLEKPQNVGVPFYLEAARPFNADYYSQDNHVLRELNTSGLFESTLFYTSSEPSATFRNDRVHPDEALWISEYIGPMRMAYIFQASELGFIIGGVIFGALHCIAWDYQFPTTIERTLWRAAAIITAALLPIYYLLLLGLWRVHRMDGVTDVMLGWVSILVYTSARLYILVEIFRSLFYLPPGAFIGTWSSSIPHIG
jgi:hypothetical protein